MRGAEGRERERERLLGTICLSSFLTTSCHFSPPESETHVPERRVPGGHRVEGGSRRGRGLLAEGLIDEAAAAATCSWTGHMILSATPFFSPSVLQFPGGLTMTHGERGGGGWPSEQWGGGLGAGGGEHHLRENSCSLEGQPPTAAPFLSGPDCQTMFSALLTPSSPTSSPLPAAPSRTPWLRLLTPSPPSAGSSSSSSGLEDQLCLACSWFSCFSSD